MNVMRVIHFHAHYFGRVFFETLAALGKRPFIIPGRANRAAAFFLQRLIPRAAAIRLMGRVLRGMYS